jgi:hypothetical protein
VQWAEHLWELLLLTIPAVAVFWCWRNKPVSGSIIRKRLSIAALALTTATLLVYEAFWISLFLPNTGTGVARWERAVSIMGVGFWLSLASSAVSIPSVGRAGKVLITLSLAGVAFWMLISIPVVNALSIERFRRHAQQPTAVNK